MIKKLLVGLAVLSCTISPQSSFAAENGTAAIYHWEVRQQEMKQHYPSLAMA